ncbi:MAG: DUF1284 domain-containing protein [Armatimonadota bacterium]
MPTITIRGEHLINVYWYLHDPTYRLKFGPAQGYDECFARRHDEIIAELIANPDQPVKAVLGLDDICLKSPCPKLNDQCTVPELLEKDARTTETFGLEIDRVYSSAEFIAKLNEMPEDQAPK